MMGADISYTAIDSLKFRVTVKWYRDCRGISLNNGGLITIRCNQTTQTKVLSLISIQEITRLCSSVAPRCNPQNTIRTGEGVEEHTYSGIVDFNQAPFNSLRSCSQRVIISASINARNGAITTGPSGTLYTQAEVDLSKAPKNSSPALTTYPIIFLCCDQPVYDNCGALDTANFDSLSYAWGQPQRGYGQQTNYSGNFAYNNPFTVYYPSPALTFPFNNPNANPPEGIYLNKRNGDIVFTPINCSGEVTVAVVEITEWKKDGLGIYNIVGKSRRDMQFIVQNCPGNNPPVVNGPYSHTICEGNQLCFNITTNDLPVIPLPPAPIPPLDTVLLEWNSGISGATFTILDPSARLKTGRFCWTPPIGAASTLPYTFIATAIDDACPINAVSHNSFSILVNKQNKHMLGGDTSVCTNNLLLTSEALGKKYWNTGDTTNAIKVDSSGLYTVTSRGTCQESDSIYVTFFQNKNINLGKDTSICDDSITINAGTHFTTYTWGDLSNDSKLTVFKTGDYFVHVVDSNGCPSSDSVNIQFNKNNKDPLIARNGYLVTSNQNGRHEWYRNDTLIDGFNDNFITISSIGKYYSIMIDSNGCKSDTSNSINKTANLHQIKKNKLTIYPNPSDGVINVNIEHVKNIQNINLVNTQGQIIHHTAEIQGNNLIITHHSTPGVFWIIIATDKVTYIQEMVNL